MIEPQGGKLVQRMAAELGITPLFFERTSYFRVCDGMASPKTCGHGRDSRILLSGTEVRAILRDGGQLPREFTRPEVGAVLQEAFAQQEV